MNETLKQKEKEIRHNLGKLETADITNYILELSQFAFLFTNFTKKKPKFNLNTAKNIIISNLQLIDQIISTDIGSIEGNIPHLINIFCALINPFNDDDIVWETWKVSMDVLDTFISSKTCTYWKPFFQEFFFGRENSKIIVGNNQIITQEMYIKCIRYIFDKLSLITDPIKVHDWWYVILTYFFHDFRSVSSEKHMKATQEISKMILKNIDLTLDKGFDLLFSSQLLNSSLVFEVFVVVTLCLRESPLFTSPHNSSSNHGNANAYQDDFIMDDQSISLNSVIELCYRFLFKIFKTNYILQISPDETEKGNTKFAQGYYKTDKDTIKLFQQICNSPDHNKLIFYILSTYFSLIQLIDANNEVVGKLLMSLRMIVFLIMQITKSLEIFKTFVTFFCGLTNFDYVPSFFCCLLAILIDALQIVDFDSNLLGLKSIAANVTTIFQNFNKKEVMIQILCHFTSHIIVLFMKSILGIESFPLHIEVANLNPVIFAENYLNDSNQVLQEICPKNYNYNFLFLKPFDYTFQPYKQAPIKDYNNPEIEIRRSLEASGSGGDLLKKQNHLKQSEIKDHINRFIVDLLNSFQDSTESLMLPTMCESYVQMVNFIVPDDNSDFSLLYNVLLDKLLSNLLEKDCPYLPLKFRILSNVITSDYISPFFTKNRCIRLITAMINSCQMNHTQDFLTAFFISVNYFLDSKPFAFSLIQMLTPLLARINIMNLDKVEFSTLASFTTSIFTIMKSSQSQTSIQISKSLTPQLIHTIKDMIQNTKYIKTIDSMLSHIFINAILFSQQTQIIDPELYEIFNTYLTEILPEQEQTPHVFLKTISQCAIPIISYYPLLIEEFIKTLNKIIISSKQEIYTSCSLLVDILLQLPPNSQYIKQIYSFLSQDFGEKKYNRFRDEEYNFYISNYKREFTEHSFDKDQDLILLSGIDRHSVVKLFGDYLRLSITTSTNSSIYKFSDINSTKNQISALRNPVTIENCWGSLVSISSFPLFIDAFNENNNLRLQVSLNQNEHIQAFTQLFKRNKVNIITSSCQFIPKDCTRDKVPPLSWDKYPPDFKNFLKSFGNVSFETNENEHDQIDIVNVIYKNSRNKLICKVGNKADKIFSIIWDDGGKAMNKATTQWNQNKVEIDIMPIENGYFRVRVRVKELYNVGPLCQKQIVSKRNLPLLIRQTVINISYAISSKSIRH